MLGQDSDIPAWIKDLITVDIKQLAGSKDQFVRGIMTVFEPRKSDSVDI